MSETKLKAETALEEIKNRIIELGEEPVRFHTALDDYLYEIANWGLGLQEYAPNPDDFGLDPKGEVKP